MRKQEHRRKENFLSAVFLVCTCALLILVMKLLDGSDAVRQKRVIPAQLATLTDRDPQEVGRVLSEREKAEKEGAKTDEKTGIQLHFSLIRGTKLIKQVKKITNADMGAEFRF